MNPLKCDQIRPISSRPPPSKHRSKVALSLYRTFSSSIVAGHRSVLVLLLLLTHLHQICLCENAKSVTSNMHPHHSHHSHHHHQHYTHHSSSKHTTESYSIHSPLLSQVSSETSTVSAHQRPPLHSTLLEQHNSFVRLHANTPLLSKSSSDHSPTNHFVVVQHPKKPKELSQTKCVERCSCKWRSGKMWVECLEAGLNMVPRGLDSGTQVLHLSGNPLRELEARVFERADLRNLQRLHLSNCRINEINADAFQQLSNLIELELAQNELTTLPSLALVHCPILRKLSLARNQIKVVKNSAFQKLFHLQAIDLSSNGLEMIESDAFYGLKNLKQLYLHENKLRYIEGQTMQSLPSVYELTLQHNPWWCDCGLRSFRNWMLEHRIPLSYSPNCSMPSRLAGKSWSQLDLDEFACPPDVVSVNTEVVVYEGENASIGCVIAAIPNVNIGWEWRGRSIRNMSLMTFGRQMYLIRESHSPSDSGNFVVDKIINGNGNDADRSVVSGGNEYDNENNQLANDMPLNKDFNIDQQSLIQREIVAGNNRLNILNSLPMMSDIAFDGGSRNGLFMSSFVGKPLMLPLMAQPTRNKRTKRSSLTKSTMVPATGTISLDDTYKRTSTLYIMNALEKDSGSYICTGSNKAGSVSANVTLTVLRRLEVTAAAYSGEEVAGIVLGALFVFLLTFVAICFVVLRSKNGMSRRQTTTTTTNSTNGTSNGGTNGTVDGQTLLSSAKGDYGQMNGGGQMNGKLANGNAHHPLPNGNVVANGTLRRNSTVSTDTKDSKLSTLLVSLNGATNGSIPHLEMLSDQSPTLLTSDNNPINQMMTIRTNKLSEQIEMSNYTSHEHNIDGATVDMPNINHISTTNQKSNINLNNTNLNQLPNYLNANVNGRTTPNRINCYSEDDNAKNETDLDDDQAHRHNMAIINSFYSSNCANLPNIHTTTTTTNGQITATNYCMPDNRHYHHHQQQQHPTLPANSNRPTIAVEAASSYYQQSQLQQQQQQHSNVNNNSGSNSNNNDANGASNINTRTSCNILNGIIPNNSDNYGTIAIGPSSNSSNNAVFAVLNAAQAASIKCNNGSSNGGGSSSSQYSSLSLSSNGTTATASSSSSSQSPSASANRSAAVGHSIKFHPNYGGNFSNLPQKPYSVVQPIIGGGVVHSSIIPSPLDPMLYNGLSDIYRINPNHHHGPPSHHPHQLINNHRTSPYMFAQQDDLSHNQQHYSIEENEIELHKRHAANSVAEELQQRIAMAGTLKRNSSVDSASSTTPSTGQVVRFANSPTVYNYSTTMNSASAAAVASVSPVVPSQPHHQNKHLNSLNRIRNGGGGTAGVNPIMAVAIGLNARDSPDEGLGEESDVLE